MSSTRALPGHTLLRPRGTLAALEIERIARITERLLRAGSTGIEIDLRAVDHVDFRAVPPLLDLVARAEQAGCRLRLTNASPHVRAVFRFASPTAIEPPGGWPSNRERARAAG